METQWTLMPHSYAPMTAINLVLIPITNFYKVLLKIKQRKSKSERRVGVAFFLCLDEFVETSYIGVVTKRISMLSTASSHSLPLIISLS